MKDQIQEQEQEKKPQPAPKPKNRKSSEEAPSPSDSGSQSEPQTSSFDDDINLRNLDEDTKKKIARVWGITSDSFYKEINSVRFYKTNKDKVYLGSYKANDLALIKDRKTGDEGTNQSTFTPAELISMSESEMVAMLNRVNFIPESKPTENNDEINYPKFESDFNLSTIMEHGRKRLSNLWGVTPDKYIDTIQNDRVYKTKFDDVRLVSYDKGQAGNLRVALVKKVGGRYCSKNSTFLGNNDVDFRDKFHSMEDELLTQMINRVNSITSCGTNESKSNMKKILKEEYQKRQTDKQIISKRFNILSESKSAELIISEVNYLQKQKFSESLIKEGLFELIQAMYKDDADLVPKLKNSYKSWISKRLPNESELFKKSLEKSIDDLDDEKLPSLFTDCHQVVEMMYDAILSGMVNDRFDVVGVPKDIEDLLRREIIDNLKQDNMKLKIKAQLVNKICPQYGDLIRNTQKTFDDIKTKLLS